MSFEAAAWAIRQRPKTATEKLVLISLADHHNKSTGRCDPSMTTIAEDALCSRRQAMRCVESLIDQGFVSAGKAHGKCSQYTLQFDRTGDTHVTSDKKSLVTPTSPVKGSTGDTESPPETPTGDTHVTKLVTPMSPEPGSNQESSAPTPSGGRRKPKTSAPDDFPITDRMRAYFDSKGVPGFIEDVTDHFLTHHRAKGTTHADWYAAWQLWCRNQIKFAADRGSNPSARTHREL